MVLVVAVLILPVGVSEYWSLACWPEATTAFGSTLRDQAALFRIALFAPHGEGPRKGGLNPACLTHTWLASCNQRASQPSGKKKDLRKPMARRLKVVFWNIRTMQDSGESDRPQKRSALVARELAQLDIDVAARSTLRRTGIAQWAWGRLHPFFVRKGQRGAQTLRSGLHDQKLYYQQTPKPPLLVILIASCPSVYIF